MKINRNVIFLSVVVSQMLVQTVSFAESSAKKQTATQIKLGPVRPSYIRLKNKTDKQPLVSSSLNKLTALQRSKVTSIKAKPNKAIARQIQPLSVKHLGTNVGGRAGNTAGSKAPSRNRVDQLGNQLGHANQARGTKEMSEMTGNQLGVLNRDNQMNSHFGLGGNDLGGYNFGRRGEDNGNENNGPARVPLGPSSVRGAAAGASQGFGALGSARPYRPQPGSLVLESTTSDGTSSQASHWTGAGDRGSKTLINQYHPDGSHTQFLTVTNPDGSRTRTRVEIDQKGNETGRTVSRREAPSEDTEEPETSEDDSGENTEEPETSTEVDRTIDPNADNGDNNWDDVVEQINGIKKDTRVKTHKYVNPGKKAETGSNSSPKAILFIPKDKLVTNPDPDNARGQDAVARRPLSQQEVIDGSTAGGPIGRGQ